MVDGYNTENLEANRELSDNIYVKLDKLKLITNLLYRKCNLAIKTGKSFMTFIHVIYQMKPHLRCFPSVCKLMVALSDICFHVFCCTMANNRVFLYIQSRNVRLLHNLPILFVALAHCLEETDLLQTQSISKSCRLCS